MSSPWTHSICEDCWKKKEPDRPAFSFHENYRQQEVCCYCQKSHRSGIYVRDDPRTLPCKGNHKDADESEFESRYSAD